MILKYMLLLNYGKICDIIYINVYIERKIYMASFSMHLSIAKLYLDRHTEEDEYEFVRGSIEPDLAPFLEKGRTHYGLHAAWANPAKYLQENGKSLENSFKRGYFLHHLTDYLFYHY